MACFTSGQVRSAMKTDFGCASASAGRNANSLSADSIEEARVADLGGVLRQLDVDPGDDVAERAILERPARALRRAQLGLAETLERFAPFGIELAEPAADGVCGTRPRHLLARKTRVAERVIEHHRPPEAHVPGEPGDARGAEVVALAIGPVGAP